ncbi:MAG: enoyl-CoA hydratase-related protein, partial [Janthinobacterium lividum]
MTAIHHDVGADGILTLTIDLPGQSMNVINAEFTADLAAAIDTIKATAAIKGVVITSGKASGFMAGADLKGMGDRLGGGASGAGRSKMAGLFDSVFELNQLFRRLETCGKPVAAAINGLAL